MARHGGGKTLRRPLSGWRLSPPFSAASILRLVFFVMVRSVYQTERPLSNLSSGPKNQVHFKPAACIAAKVFSAAALVEALLK